MKIQKNIIEILKNCTLESNLVYLPNTQLDRKTYVKVNEILESIGGKWNKKQKAHVFDSDVSDLMENVISNEETTTLKELQKQFQFFPTPEHIVEKMLSMISINDSHDILEPSAGKGNIIDKIPFTGNIVAVELNPEYESILKTKTENVIISDFLNVNPDLKKFDVIIMNPPFSKQQDIDHILHAYKFLKPNGKLISVISESPFYRTNKKAEDFRNWLNEKNVSVVDNEAGDFKESGTNIKTKIVLINS
jgi:phospholipid N-methyltransferase